MMPPTKQHSTDAGAIAPASGKPPLCPLLRWLERLLNVIIPTYRVHSNPRRRARLEAAMDRMSLKPEYTKVFGAEDDLNGVYNPTRWLELFHHCLGLHLDFDAFADWYLSKFNPSLGYDALALRARLYRTQLAYLTELHTVYQLAELGWKVERGWSLETRGVDAQLALSWGVVNLHILADTDRAWKMLAHKLRSKRAGSAAGCHFYLAYPLGDGSVMRTLQGGIQVFEPSALEAIMQRCVHPQMEQHTAYPAHRRVWLVRAGVVK